MNVRKPCQAPPLPLVTPPTCAVSIVCLQAAPAADMQLQQQLQTAPLPHHQQQCCHPQQLLHRQRLQGSSSSSAATFSGTLQPGSCIHSSWQLQQQQQQGRGSVRASAAAAAAADGFDSSGEAQHSHGSTSKAIPPRIEAAADQETYSLRDTQVGLSVLHLNLLGQNVFALK